MIEQNRWEFKRAIKNTFTWDKDDWKYIKNHIVWLLVILLLSYLYYSEVRVTREAIRNPIKFCVEHSLYTPNLNDTINNLTNQYKSNCCPCLSLRGINLSDG